MTYIGKMMTIRRFAVMAGLALVAMIGVVACGDGDSDLSCCYEGEHYSCPTQDDNTSCRVGEDHDCERDPENDDRCG